MSNSELENFINDFLVGEIGIFKLINEQIENYVFNDLKLSYSLISNCSIKNCVFNNVSLYDSNLSRTDFENCTFNKCDLSEATIFRTKFNGSIFEESTLIKLDALETQFKKTDFIDCDFKLFDFGSARIDECKVINPKNFNSDGLAFEMINS